MEVFAKPENFTEPNGVTLSPDGKTLFVATDEGVSAFDVNSKARHQLTHPADVSLKGIDGLYFYRGSLIALHPGRIIVDNLPSATVHSGGELSFGPDGMLYATIGDARRLDLVQDANLPIGKVLRYCRDGSIPQDNPIPKSPVYALGLRNPQGFDWHPEAGALFGAEHGPTDFPEEGGRRDQDERKARRGNGSGNSRPNVGTLNGTVYAHQSLTRCLRRSSAAGKARRKD